uniref:Uncharacterized protein n=1 Tax=Oryza meridionalis TaxID=40149 RepID=A0A0E0E0B0_9ORYZ
MSPPMRTRSVPESGVSVVVAPAMAPAAFSLIDGTMIPVMILGRTMIPLMYHMILLRRHDSSRDTHCLDGVTLIHGFSYLSPRSLDLAFSACCPPTGVKFIDASFFCQTLYCFDCKIISLQNAIPRMFHREAEEPADGEYVAGRKRAILRRFHRDAKELADDARASERKRGITCFLGEFTMMWRSRRMACTPTGGSDESCTEARASEEVSPGCGEAGVWRALVVVLILLQRVQLVDDSCSERYHIGIRIIPFFNGIPVYSIPLFFYGFLGLKTFKLWTVRSHQDLCRSDYKNLHKACRSKESNVHTPSVFNV